MRSTLSPDDAFAELGLAPSATAEEITRAYRSLAKRLHPDLNPDLPAGVAEARFKRLGAAYGTARRHAEAAAQRGGEPPARTEEQTPTRRAPPDAREVPSGNRLTRRPWLGPSVLAAVAAAALVLGLPPAGQDRLDAPHGEEPAATVALDRLLSVTRSVTLTLDAERFGLQVRDGRAEVRTPPARVILSTARREADETYKTLRARSARWLDDARTRQRELRERLTDAIRGG